MNKNIIIKGYFFAVISAVIYGCMPLMAKKIYALGVNPMTLVLLRNFLAVPFLAVLAHTSGQGLKLSVKALPNVSLIAFLGCCATPVLLFSAYNYIPSGTATVFHFVYPALVVLAGVLFLKRPINKGNIIAVMLCLLGIVMFYDPNAVLNLQGSGLALLSGVTFAVYVLLLSRSANSSLSGIRFTFYTSAISSVIMLIICLICGQLSLPNSAEGWFCCSIFAIAVTVGAVVLFQQGTFLIGGERTSILSVLEPITGVLIGAVVLHEPLGIRTAIGSVLVIAASILIALMDARKKRGVCL